MTLSKRSLLWLFPLGIYLIFSYWYTNTGGPLTEDEVTFFVGEMEKNGYTESQVTDLSRFMREDSGRQFIMLNNIKMANPPQLTPGMDPSASASDLMAIYMAHMFPNLLSRACHPIYSGHAVFQAMDVTGIENAYDWDQGALMRYRSRRDIMEIIIDPMMQEKHGYKLASLSKTIAYPLESDLNYSDLRLILALVLFSLVSLADLLLYRRPNP